VKIGADDFLANGHTLADMKALAVDEVREPNVPQASEKPKALPKPLPVEEWHNASEWAHTPYEMKQPLVKGLIYPGVVACLAGPTGIGKTYLGLQLSAAIAEGKPFLDYEVSQAKVVYVNLELPDWEIKNRSITLGEPSGLMIGNLRGLDVMNLHSVGRGNVESKVRETGAKLIVIDTVKRAHNKDENDNSAAAEVMGVFEEWAAKLNVAVLYLHHTRKMSQNREDWFPTLDDVRAAGVWTAHAGVVMVMAMDPADDKSYGVIFKNNFDIVHPRKWRRLPTGYFEATDWRKDVTDEELRAFIGALKNPFTEQQMAKFLSEKYHVPADRLRTRLMGMRMSGALEGLWSQDGKTIMYGRYLPDNVVPFVRPKDKE